MMFFRRNHMFGVGLIGVCLLTLACSSTLPDAVASTRLSAAAAAATAPPTKVERIPPPPPTERNVTAWPFASSSIWNIPIGKGAALMPALLPPVDGPVLSSDENVLIMTPQAPLIDVFTSDAEWDPRRSRCGEAQTGKARYQIPVPPTFFTDPGFEGDTPNQAGAVLLSDGRTVLQTQPLHRCPAGYAVTKYDFDSLDIYSDGRLGAHGGSGLSTLGGAIRVGELNPGNVIRHALKFELNATKLLAYPPDGTPGYRWPADRADGYAPTKYGGTNPQLEMGTLLTLPDGFDVESLNTEPGRILGRALRDYGAYIVDDTAWTIYSFATEWGPAGRVNDEMVKNYGHRFGPDQKATCTSKAADCLWVKDMAKLIEGLSIVTNSTETEPGGPGVRRTYCAPSLTAQDVQPSTCPPLPAIVVAQIDPPQTQPKTSIRATTTKTKSKPVPSSKGRKKAASRSPITSAK